MEQKIAEQANKPEKSYALNPTDEIFKGSLLEKAVEIQQEFEMLDKNEPIVKIKRKQLQKKRLKNKKIKKTIVKKKIKS